MSEKKAIHFSNPLLHPPLPYIPFPLTDYNEQTENGEIHPLVPLPLQHLQNNPKSYQPHPKTLCCTNTETIMIRPHSANVIP